MGDHDTDADAAFLEQLLVGGFEGMTSITMKSRDSAFGGKPHVFYPVHRSDSKFKRIMNLFNVHCNDHGENNFACLHLVIAHYDKTRKWIMRSVVIVRSIDIFFLCKDVMQITSGLLIAMLKYADPNTIASGYAHRYLIVPQEIVISCDHLIAFLDLPVTSESWLLFKQIIDRLRISEESITEVRSRRPQLLIDVTIMNVKSFETNYEDVITKLSELFQIDVDYWSVGHGSVLYHLIDGTRGRDINNPHAYICKLLSTADTNQSCNGTPLICCYLQKTTNINYDVMKIFLNRSTNWNVIDEFGKCPLHYLAKAVNMVNGSRNEIVGLVISSGARLDFVDHQVNSILHGAMSSNVDLVRLLLDGHTNSKQFINSRNENGNSCLGLLMKQLSNDWARILNYLVECGADVNEIDHDGNNLLHLALDKDMRRLNGEQIENVMTTLSNLGLNIEVAINQLNRSKHVPFYNAIKSGVHNCRLIPSAEILNNNERWDEVSVVDFVLNSSSENMKRNRNFNDVVNGLLIRGANRCLPATLERLIALNELRRTNSVLVVLENANQEMIARLKLEIPNIINKIINFEKKSTIKSDLLPIIKILVEKFDIDVGFVTDEDGFVIHNLIALDKSVRQEVLSYVLELEVLEVDKKVNGVSGLDFAISNRNYEAAAKLIEHYADFNHWQSVTIYKRTGFTRLAKLLTVIVRPSVEIKFESYMDMPEARAVRQFQHWISERKRTVQSLSEMCAHAVRRGTRTRSELKNIIKDIELPEDTKDVLFLRKEF